MSFECQFITQSLQCKCYFCFLLKGFSSSDKAVETQHPENLSCSTSVISCASGTLPTKFLGPCYIFPRIFPIALTPSKIAKLLVGTSGRLSAILPSYSVYNIAQQNWWQCFQKLLVIFSKNIDLRSATGFKINSANPAEVIGNNSGFF